MHKNDYDEKNKKIFYAARFFKYTVILIKICTCSIPKIHVHIIQGISLVTVKVLMKKEQEQSFLPCKHSEQFFKVSLYRFPISLYRGSTEMTGFETYQAELCKQSCPLRLVGQSSLSKSQFSSKFQQYCWEISWINKTYATHLLFTLWLFNVF